MSYNPCNIYTKKVKIPHTYPYTSQLNDNNLSATIYLTKNKQVPSKPILPPDFFSSRKKIYLPPTDMPIPLLAIYRAKNKRPFF